jgi:hypothetical protein
MSAAAVTEIDPSVLGGRWQFERSWIDWLGFALGIAWIGLVLALFGSFVLIR